MPLRAVLSAINVFLALAAFLAVGAISLAAAEELVWAVGKAVGSFVVCWVVLGFLSNLLVAVIEAGQSDLVADKEARASSPTDAVKKG